MRAVEIVCAGFLLVIATSLVAANAYFWIQFDQVLPVLIGSTGLFIALALYIMVDSFCRNRRQERDEGEPYRQVESDR